MRLSFLGVLAVLVLPLSAQAGLVAPPPVLFAHQPVRNPWSIDWRSVSGPASPGPVGGRLTVLPRVTQDPGQPAHAVAIEHSQAYQMRAKIHKYASFATLPLFATELILGQSLYNGSSNQDGKRGAHAAVGAGIIGLLAANTITGAWNMFGSEGRQEKAGRTLRLAHGLLMMAADAGFLATWATAPDHEERGALTNNGDKATHRSIAIASIGVGTAGYLMMLFGNH